MAKSTQRKSNMNADPRSRAAKRATSPSIDIDKSIRDAPRTTDATPVLTSIHGSGVQKKKKKNKQMTRGQRARQERGLSRAEAVMDQLAQKVDDAESRKKKIDKRKGGWDEINNIPDEENEIYVKTRVQASKMGEPVQNKENENGDINMRSTEISVGNPSDDTKLYPISRTTPDEADLIT